MDIYTHVCERLRADNCRRLTQYNGYGPNGPCRFTTWLAAVCLNIAREWIRTTRGRRRFYSQIRELSRLDQDVFRYYYWEGYSAAEIARLLSTGRRHDLAERDVETTLVRIRGRLSRDHLWRLISARARDGRLHAARHGVSRAPAAEREAIDRRSGAEALSGRTAAGRILARAVQELPILERRAVLRRYRDGRSAKSIAEELGIENFKRVYEIQARAVLRLRRKLAAEGLSLDDFEPRVLEQELLG